MTKQYDAEEVLKKYSTADVPVNVEDICKEYGIKVFVEDLSELEKKCSRPISGLIYKTNDVKVIFVNRGDILQRRRFTIAHELGHFFLHFDGSGKDTIISFRGLRNKEESEADRFAANLLMPQERLLKEYHSIPYPTASYLSKIFNVSVAAMRYRLSEMGLTYIG